MSSAAYEPDSAHDEAKKLAPSEVIAAARAQADEIDDLVHANRPRLAVAWIVVALLVAVAALVAAQAMGLGDASAFSISTAFLPGVAVIVAFAIYGALRVVVTLTTSSSEGERFVLRQRELAKRAEQEMTVEMWAPKARGPADAPPPPASLT